MDQDVEHKLNRLCTRYVEAASEINLMLPTNLQTGRGTSRTLNRVVNVLGRLGEARKPASAALLRLAYVRAMRASQPHARLGPEQEVELAALEERMDEMLGTLEAQALLNFRRHQRRLSLRKVGTALGAGGVAAINLPPPYPIEQHARTSIHSIVEEAGTAGALAGTQAGSYDRPDHDQ